MSDGLGGCAACLSPDDSTWQRVMAMRRLESAEHLLVDFASCRFERVGSRPSSGPFVPPSFVPPSFVPLPFRSTSLSFVSPLHWYEEHGE